MPIENLSGAFVPGRELQHDIEEALLSRFDLVRGEEQERFLSRRRLRWTGGLDAASALAARQELGADAVLITTVTIYREGPPPVLALTMRLVATGDDPSIVWMETASKAGDDEPGVLGLGLVDDLKVLRGLLLGRLFASMEEAREGRGNRMGGLCDSDRWSRPRVAFRSPLLDGAEMRRAAVLPLLNRSGRRGAGEAMSLELVRQLAASGRYRVLEPGVVRDFLLSRRIMVPGGVSLETSRLFVGVLGVDLLFSGSILDYDETGLPRGPTIRFNLVGLEGGTGEVVWSSTSFSHGDDGVYFFGAGRVATASQLSCRMMGGVMQRLLGVGGSSPLPPLDRALRDRLLHPGGIQAYVPPTQPWPGSGQ